MTFPPGNVMSPSHRFLSLTLSCFPLFCLFSRVSPGPFPFIPAARCFRLLGRRTSVGVREGGLVECLERQRGRERVGK